MATLSESDFTAPGPGLWVHNAEHFPRPVSRLFIQMGYWTRFGARQGLRRYGSFGEGPRAEFVQRFQYNQPSQIIARPGGDDQAARTEFERRVASSGEAQARMANAQRVFEERLWREDVQRWDEIEKPGALYETIRLAATDPQELDSDGLAMHFAECFAHVSSASSRHHQFNGTWWVPLGALLRHTVEWSGRDSSQILRLLEGASPVSRGSTSEIEEVVRAIRADSSAARLLDSEIEPLQILANLRSSPGDVGSATTRFLHTFGHLMVGGFDLIDTYALERPETLLAQIRLAVDGEEDPHRDQRTLDETSMVRSEIPTEYHASFDELLSEARFVYRIKDERGVYNDMGARGLIRRAVMEAGRRLVADGVLEDAGHLLEGDLLEIQRALLNPRTVDAGALSARYEFRIGNSDMRPPAILGTPEPPIPVDWLPAPVKRVQQAMAGARDAIVVEASGGDSPSQIMSGAAAGVGRYEGTARVILAPADYHRIQEGDVLVTTMTTPALSAWMPLIGAIVTDHGGALSHAAIVAREFGIPAAVGTGVATSSIPDGERIVVDGDSGTVERISQR